MHKKCQICVKVRQFFLVLLCAGVTAVLSEQAGFAPEVTLWLAFAAAVIPMMWFGYSQRKRSD